MYGRFFALLVLGVRVAGACTEIHLTGAGFAANAVHLLHAYTLFSENNGTMYVNSTAFEYKCSHSGGWHDFFTFDGTNGTIENVDKMPPDEACAQYSFEDVDILLDKMKYDWFSIDQNAAKKASAEPILCYYRDSPRLELSSRATLLHAPGRIAARAVKLLQVGKEQLLAPYCAEAIFGAACRSGGLGTGS